MAATIFPGEPPLLLDFEKPEEMIRQQQLAEEEIQRRPRVPPKPRRQKLKSRSRSTAMCCGSEACDRAWSNCPDQSQLPDSRSPATRVLVAA